MRNSQDLFPDADPRPLASPAEPSASQEAMNSTVHYEPRNVPIGWILIVLAAIGVAALLDSYAAWRFFHDQNADEDAAKASQYPLASEDHQALPVRPRLEQLDRLSGNLEGDSYSRERNELAILNGSGPSDEPGFVHIPIERAIEMIVPRLPVRPPARAVDPRKSRGLLYSGDSNSGRVLQGAEP